MRFDRYASLADDDVWPYETPGPLRERLRFARHALARSLGAEGFEALGEQPLRAFENAEPLEGPFPLVVVGQGLYYESPIAFVALSEYLAGRGFVVATGLLVGVRMKAKSPPRYDVSGYDEPTVARTTSRNASP